MKFCINTPDNIEKNISIIKNIRFYKIRSIKLNKQKPKNRVDNLPINILDYGEVVSHKTLTLVSLVRIKVIQPVARSLLDMRQYKV